MKSSHNTRWKPFSLLASILALLFCSCASDVDPGLRAKKAEIEKQIAKYEAYLEKMAIKMAQRAGWMAIDYINKDVKAEDLENTALDTRNVYVATQRLKALHQELADVNKEINRQMMIAPNLLVDVMDAHSGSDVNRLMGSHSQSPAAHIPMGSTATPGVHVDQ